MLGGRFASERRDFLRSLRGVREPDLMLLSRSLVQAINTLMKTVLAAQLDDATRRSREPLHHALRVPP